MLMVSPPYYFGAELTSAEIVEHYRQIANAVSIPIMLYNDPPITGFDLTTEIVAELAQEPNISYIKESSYNVRRIGEILSVISGEKMTVFTAAYFTALEAFVLGAVGWITGMQNFYPGACVELFDMCVERQDFVAGRKLYFEKILPVGRLFSELHKPTGIVKGALEMIGIPMGKPRLPFQPLNKTERARVREVLEQVGAL